MENLTNQIIKLGNDKSYFILRQATYKGTTYFLGAEVTPDQEDFTNNFAFLEQIVVDGAMYTREVKNQDIIEVLAKNIKLD